MATFTQLPATITVEATLKVGEAELRALDALVGYGDDAFLKFFYSNLGTAYMKPHEAGLRSLFKAIRNQVPPVLDRIDNARKAFEERGR